MHNPCIIALPPAIPHHPLYIRFSHIGQLSRSYRIIRESPSYTQPLASFVLIISRPPAFRFVIYSMLSPVLLVSSRIPRRIAHHYRLPPPGSRLPHSIVPFCLCLCIVFVLQFTYRLVSLLLVLFLFLLFVVFITGSSIYFWCGYCLFLILSFFSPRHLQYLFFPSSDLVSIERIRNLCYLHGFYRF